MKRIAKYKLRMTENGHELFAWEENSDAITQRRCHSHGTHIFISQLCILLGLIGGATGCLEDRSTLAERPAQCADLIQDKIQLVPRSNEESKPSEIKDLTSDQPIVASLKSRQPTHVLGETPKFDVLLHNVSREPVTLVGSMDGSDLKCRYPHAFFLVDGPRSSGERARRWNCPSHQNSLTEASFVEVQPGDAFDPYQSGYSENGELRNLFGAVGEYRVRFGYSTFNPDFISWNPFLISCKGNGRPVCELLDRVPKVSIVSNDVIVSIVKPEPIASNDSSQSDEVYSSETPLQLDSQRDDQYPSLSCELTTSRLAYKLGEFPDLAVHITNKGDRPVFLVKYLENSALRFRVPHCYFTVDGPDGLCLSRWTARCGNQGPIKESDFVQVLPGEYFDPHTASQRELCEFQCQFKAPGEYRIRHYYSTFEHDIRRWAPEFEMLKVDDLDSVAGKGFLEKYRETPRVSLVSNEVVIRFEE